MMSRRGRRAMRGLDGEPRLEVDWGLCLFLALCVVALVPALIEWVARW